MSNFFDKLFNRKPDVNESGTFQQFSSTGSAFTIFSGNAYSNDIYRSGVDAIAKHFAKLKPTHYISDEQGETDLNYILQVRPNEYITTYDLLYKLITHLYLFNNAYVYISKDETGKVDGLYPVTYSNAQFGTDSRGQLLIHFNFKDGTEVYLPYSHIIHLRRNFNDDELIGDTNQAIDNVLEVSHAQNQGMVSSIKMASNIRGIVKYNQLMNDEKIQENHKKFMDSFMSMENNGGVISLDDKTEYTPIQNTATPMNQKDLETIQERIYNYLGISKKMVNATFDENEFTAFYESTIEPIALQLSLEFTEKMFSDIERQHGNEIRFESGRLQYSNNETKIKLVSELLPSGLLTINQALNVLGLPKLDDEQGNKRLQTLNYIDADIAEQYQLNKKGGQTDE